MPTITTSIGALRLRLSKVERGFVADLQARPFMRLDDGTDVGVFERDGRLHLLIDHRRDADALTRIEVWEPEALAEADVAGLWILVEAVSATRAAV